MAKLLISTALAGLLLSGAALAQPPDDHHDRGHGPAPSSHSGPPPAALHASAPRSGPATAPVPGNPGNHVDFHRGNVAAMDQRSTVDHRPSAGQQAAPQAQPAPRAAMRGAPGQAHGPNLAMRGPTAGGASRNHDFTSYHRNFSSPHRFHAATYRRPQGWYAHRWTFGETLPALFWSQNYWLSDYVDFDLMPPPPGTVWVRDGGDALLIDQYNGQIVQVAYNVFY